MAAKKQKSLKEIKEENDLMMAKAAVKSSIMAFINQQEAKPPVELLEYWSELKPEEWRHHLKLFDRELKKFKHPKVKEIFFDLENYIKDCKRMYPEFSRSKAEVLLMIAIGEIQVEELIAILGYLPSNKEKLDRKIEKQIKVLDWEDDQDLDKLDYLTSKLENPRIKKTEVEEIDKNIAQIEENIKGRKVKRDNLAIKLIEWKARGNIDIAGGDGQFRLDA